MNTIYGRVYRYIRSRKSGRITHYSLLRHFRSELNTPQLLDIVTVLSEKGYVGVTHNPTKRPTIVYFTKTTSSQSEEPVKKGAPNV